jgi:hypothetical protein
VVRGIDPKVREAGTVLPMAVPRATIAENEPHETTWQPPANSVPEHEYDILLGRPNDHSTTVSALLFKDVEAVIV